MPAEQAYEHANENASFMEPEIVPMYGVFQTPIIPKPLLGIIYIDI